MKVLKRENVCYVVAPYEADAQMTFLAISKQVDAVITEDSDLIAFGCPRVSFWQVLLQKLFLLCRYKVFVLFYGSPGNCLLNPDYLQNG